MMGVLPIQYQPGETAATLGLDGTETFDIDLADNLTPRQDLTVRATRLSVRSSSSPSSPGSTPPSRSTTSVTAASSTSSSARWRSNPGPSCDGSPTAEVVNRHKKGVLAGLCRARQIVLPTRPGCLNTWSVVKWSMFQPTSESSLSRSAS